MTFDDSTKVLTITISWQPPRNSEQFDLDNYTVNITSSSGINISVQVPAGTTTRQFTDERKQRAVFNVTVEATNRCGQTGDTDLTTQEYNPTQLSKKYSVYMVVHVIFMAQNYIRMARVYLPML